MFKERSLHRLEQYEIMKTDEVFGSIARCRKYHYCLRTSMHRVPVPSQWFLWKYLMRCELLVTLPNSSLALYHKINIWRLSVHLPMFRLRERQRSGAFCEANRRVVSKMVGIDLLVHVRGQS